MIINCVMLTVTGHVRKRNRHWICSFDRYLVTLVTQSYVHFFIWGDFWGSLIYLDCISTWNYISYNVLNDFVNSLCWYIKFMWKAIQKYLYIKWFWMTSWFSCIMIKVTITVLETTDKPCLQADIPPNVLMVPAPYELQMCLSDFKCTENLCNTERFVSMKKAYCECCSCHCRMYRVACTVWHCWYERLTAYK